ncbi:hypothetical protein P4S73_22055 [Paraglaciecola sp. Hal342]
MLKTDFSYDAGDNDIFTDGKVALERIMLSLSYSAEYWDINAEAMREKSDFKGFSSISVTQMPLLKACMCKGEYLLAQM